MSIRRLVLATLLLPVLAWAQGPFPLSEATVEQLASLDHVDAELANRIVGLRTERGGQLSSVEALRVLPGVQEESLASLRAGTTVEVAVPVGAVRTYTSSDEVLAEFAHEPTVAAVQVWAADYANVNADMVARWLTQSQTFALLPEFTFQYRQRYGKGNNFVYRTDDGSVALPGDDPSAILDRADADIDHYYTVQARWDLDKLVMSSERIRVLNEAQDVVKLRDKVLAEVTRLYFERRRVQVDMLLNPKRDLAGQVKDQLRLAELTANIDALTGGRFSEALGR
jgi:hypothetical protein